MIRRRKFIVLVSSAVAWPLSARAQQSAPKIIGIVSNGTPETIEPWLRSLGQGLSENGYIDGQHIVIRYLLTASVSDQCANLVTQHAAVIIAIGNVAARTAKTAVGTIPVVFSIGGDPVSLGLVDSLNHPGGHMTGVSILTTASETKRLELLSELVPKATDIAVLVNPNSATTDGKLNELKSAALALGRKLFVLKASNQTELENAFEQLRRERIIALLIASDNFFRSETSKLAALSQRYAIPSVFAYNSFAKEGGLASYGTGDEDNGRQVGVYVARILKGENPSDLPVLRPTKFEFVLNMRAANSFGLTIPNSLQLLADEVIE
jgi:putative tryptophan/tyrosine transport system substrate-binding protein